MGADGWPGADGRGHRRDGCGRSSGGDWVARAPGGEFVYANKVFAEIMGMARRDDVAGGEYAAPYGIHGRDGALYPEDKMPFMRALAARATIIVDDIVIHRPDGGRVNIRAQARPMFDDAGASPMSSSRSSTSAARSRPRRRAPRPSADLTSRALEAVGQLAGGIPRRTTSTTSWRRCDSWPSSLRQGEDDRRASTLSPKSEIAVRDGDRAHPRALELRAAPRPGSIPLSVNEVATEVMKKLLRLPIDPAARARRRLQASGHVSADRRSSIKW